VKDIDPTRGATPSARGWKALASQGSGTVLTAEVTLAEASPSPLFCSGTLTRNYSPPQSKSSHNTTAIKGWWKLTLFCPYLFFTL